MTKRALYGGKDIIGRILSTWRNKIVLREIKGNLVDLACGDNRLVTAYQSGLGVDRYDYGADIIATDFTKLPLQDHSADTITIVASLNYFDDPHATLREVYRILTPQGRLLITMPNMRVMKLWHKFREKHAAQPGYDHATIKRMLDESGFTIHCVQRFMFGINKLYIATKQT